MVTIQHKEITYNIPTKWEDLSIAKFYDMALFMDKSKEQGYDDEYVYSNLFKIVTGLKQPEYYALSIDNINTFKLSVQFLLKPFNSKTFERDFTHGGYRFKLKDFEEFSFGEYIDSQHLLNKEEVNMARTYALLVDIYKPKNIWKLKFKDKKLDLSLDQKEKFIGDIPITKLAGLHSFFLRGQSQLGRNTASYLVKVARRTRMQAYLGLAGHITYGLWMPVMKNWIKWMKQLPNRLGRPLHS